MTVLIWLEHILATGGDFVICPTDADNWGAALRGSALW